MKKSNGGTVRKHIVKKSNSNDMKNAGRLANKSNTQKTTASIQDSPKLSQSTIQAFQDAMHFKPLAQSQQSIDNPAKISSYACTTSNEDDAQANNQISMSNAQNNNHISDDDDNGENSDSGSKRSLFQGISLKDFEKHQQIMKEANIEKRRLLSQAIEQR